MLSYTDASALEAVAAVVLAAPGKIRLFKSTLVPTSSNVIADFEAAEADFTGYPAGGISTITPADAILTGPGVAASSYGTYTFVSGTPFTVSNLIRGFWIETAGGAMVGFHTFAAAVTIGGLGSGLVVSPEQPAGQTAA